MPANRMRLAVNAEIVGQLVDFKIGRIVVQLEETVAQDAIDPVPDRQ